MKKLLAVLLLICLLLTSCSYSDVGDLTSNDSQIGNDPTVQEGSNPYGNYDYSLKPYFNDDSLCIYQDKAYFSDGGMVLTYITFDSLTDDVDITKSTPKEYHLPMHFTCSNSEHDHTSFDLPSSCPIRLGAYSTILLDAHESGGSYPIFYFTYSFMDEPEQSAFELTQPFCLYRYDSGSNTREKLIELPGCAEQTMAYGDKIYLSIALSSSKYQLMVYDKKTKKTSTLKAGKGRLELLFADGESIYFVDRKDGSLYRSDADLAASDSVYKLNEVYEFSNGEIGMFVNDGYLYYRTNFETSPMQVHIDGVLDEDNPDPQYINPVHYDVRRLPLDSLSGEGELVANRVFQHCDFGVTDGCFYFTPCDYGKTALSGGYYNFSNGRLCKVDLKTLECTDVVKKDSGLFFDGGLYSHVTNRFIATTIRALDEPWISCWNVNNAGSHLALYDFETGSFYSLVRN